MLVIRMLVTANRIHIRMLVNQARMLVTRMLVTYRTLVYGLKVRNNQPAKSRRLVITALFCDNQHASH